MSSAPPPPPPPDPYGSGEPEEPRPGSEPAYEAPPQAYEAPPPAYEAPPQGGQPEAQAPPPAGPPAYGTPPQHAGGHGPGHAAAPAGGATALSDSEEKTWAILAHLSAPVAALLSAGLLNFVGPLVIWAIFKDRSAKVRHASAGAFNFNLTLWIVYAVLVVLSVVSLGLLLIITIPVGLVIWVVSMVLHVLAAVKASNGEVYTYPAQIPVLK
jgi:uncharacterized Tic20 family protein